MMRTPASTICPAAVCAPGTRVAARPTPVTTNPVSPKLKMLASTTVAAVWYEETTFAPAMAVASAAVCVSPARDMLHIADVDENKSAITSRIDTAAASVV